VIKRGRAGPGELGGGETGWVQAGCAGLGNCAAVLGAARPGGPERTERGCCVAALDATY
jgi:hypothetical protein